MNIEQLKNLSEKNKEKVVWTGVADRSDNIPPLLDFLNQYFNLRNHKSRKEIELNLIEATKNPNLMNTMVTELFVSLPPFIKSVLVDWVKTLISPSHNLNLPLVKDAMVNSILSEDSSKIINLSNLNSLNHSDIGKKISTILGTEMVPLANSEVRIKMRESMPMLLNLVGMALQNNQINQTQMSNMIQLIFYLSVSTDGFFEESNILGLLKSRAIKDPLNLQKSEESIAKAETKYNDQAIKFHYDQKYSGAKSMVLPLKSLNEINNLVVTIMNYIMTNELPILQNSQIYEQAKTIIYDGFMNYVPASMIEDISSVIEGKPLKTSLSELSGIHLNSVIIQRFLISKMGSNNLQITLLIMSYIVLCAMYKINPSIISTPTDLTMKFRELFRLCFGDDSLLNGITITSGKIELENVIKLDFDLQTGGYYTRTYGVLNNDAILSNPALSTIFQRVNEFNSLGFENKMRTIFPAASTPESPENIVRSLSIELLDTFFNSMSLPFFTTGTTPEIKDFLNGYIKYLKNDISMRYNLPI